MTEKRWVAWVNCMPYLFPASFERTPTMNDVRTLREDFMMYPSIMEFDSVVVSQIEVVVLQEPADTEVCGD